MVLLKADRLPLKFSEVLLGSGWKYLGAAANELADVVLEDFVEDMVDGDEKDEAVSVSVLGDDLDEDL